MDLRLVYIRPVSHMLLLLLYYYFYYCCSSCLHIELLHDGIGFMAVCLLLAVVVMCAHATELMLSCKQVFL